MGGGGEGGSETINVLSGQAAYVYSLLYFNVHIQNKLL